MTDPRIIVALDFESPEACLQVVQQLDPRLVRVKVGNELFTAAGPAIIEQLRERGFDVFLDLKYHDIPNTVAKAVKAAGQLGAWMVNVHAGGGERMLTAAREALDDLPEPPLLIAVTVLTSLSEDDLRRVGVTRPPADQVLQLAEMARHCGLDGVVCSALEAPTLKRTHGGDFKLVTPGIRPTGTDQHDQRRTLSPAGALAAGRDYLVIGRPITGAESPAEACREMAGSLESFPGGAAG